MQKRCPPGQTRDPKTGHCKQKDGPKSEKPCLPGQIRNPSTGRCVNKDGKIGQAIISAVKNIPTSINDLPDELLRKIGDKLTTSNAAKMSTLNKDMNVMYKEIVQNKVKSNELRPLVNILNAFCDDKPFDKEKQNIMRGLLPLKSLEIEFRYTAQASERYNSIHITLLNHNLPRSPGGPEIHKHVTPADAKLFTMTVSYNITSNHVDDKAALDGKVPHQTNSVEMVIPLFLRHLSAIKTVWKRKGKYVKMVLREYTKTNSTLWDHTTFITHHYKNPGPKQEPDSKIYPGKTILPVHQDVKDFADWVFNTISAKQNKEI